MIYRTSAGRRRHRLVAKLRKPRKSSGATREAVTLQPHLLQHADEDIAQGAIDLIVTASGYRCIDGPSGEPLGLCLSTPLQ